MKIITSLVALVALTGCSRIEYHLSVRERELYKKVNELSDVVQKMSDKIDKMEERVRLNEAFSAYRSEDMKKTQQICKDYSDLVGKEWTADFTSNSGRISFHCNTFDEWLPIETAELYVLRNRCNSCAKKPTKE